MGFATAMTSEAAKYMYDFDGREPEARYAVLARPAMNLARARHRGAVALIPCCPVLRPRCMA